MRPKLRYTLLLLSALSLQGSELGELFDALTPSWTKVGTYCQKVPYLMVKDHPFVEDPLVGKCYFTPLYAELYFAYKPYLPPLEVTVDLTHEFEWSDDLLLLKGLQRPHDKYRFASRADLSFLYEYGPLFLADASIPESIVNPQSEETLLFFPSFLSLSIPREESPCLALVGEEERLVLSFYRDNFLFSSYQKISSSLHELLPALISQIALADDVERDNTLSPLIPDFEPHHFMTSLPSTPFIYEEPSSIAKPPLSEERFLFARRLPSFTSSKITSFELHGTSLLSGFAALYTPYEKDPSPKNLRSFKEPLPPLSLTRLLALSKCEDAVLPLKLSVVEDSVALPISALPSVKILSTSLAPHIDTAILRQALRFFFQKQTVSDKNAYLARTSTPRFEQGDEIVLDVFSKSNTAVPVYYEREEPKAPSLNRTSLIETPFLTLCLPLPKSEFHYTTSLLLEPYQWLTFVKREREPTLPHFLSFPRRMPSTKSHVSITPYAKNLYFEATAPETLFLARNETPSGEILTLAHRTVKAPIIVCSLLDPSEVAYEFLFIEEEQTLAPKTQEAREEFSPPPHLTLASAAKLHCSSTHVQALVETHSPVDLPPLMLGSLVEKTSLIFSKTLLAPQEYELIVLSMLDTLARESPFDASPEDENVALCYSHLGVDIERQEKPLFSSSFSTEEDKEELNSLLIKKFGRIVYGAEKNRLFAYVKGESIASDHLPQLLDDEWALESPLSYRNPDSEETEVSQKRVNIEDLKNAFGIPLPGYRTLTSANLADAFEPIIVAIKPWGNHERHARINKTYRKLSADFLDYPTLEELDTISLSEPFETYIEYVPDKNRGGYLFSVELKLSQQLTYPSENQHFLFLVDRSKAVESHRYEVFKNALTRALGYLKKGDTFNIALYDSRVKYLSDEPLEASENNRAKAKFFLTEEKHAALFKPTDLFALLSKTQAEAATNEKNVNVVLMTDSSTIADLRTKRRETQKLITRHLPNYALFIATCCNRDNLAFTELLCTWNKGEVLFSPTNASFSRKFAGLIRRISRPIASNLALTPLIRDGQNKITFFNIKSYDHPNLYAENPLKLYGHIDKIEDFSLCLQGISKENQFLNITQEVSFAKSLRVGRGLRKEIAKKETLPYYLKYLDTGELSHLEKAYNITKSFDIDLPHEWE